MLCPLPKGRDHSFRVGEAVVAEQPSQQTDRLFADQKLSVHDHVELAGAARLQLGFDAEGFFDLGGETRRLGLVASAHAVKNGDIHGHDFFFPRLHACWLGAHELREFEATPCSLARSSRCST